MSYYVNNPIKLAFDAYKLAQDELEKELVRVFPREKNNVKNLYKWKSAKGKQGSKLEHLWKEYNDALLAYGQIMSRDYNSKRKMPSHSAIFYYWKGMNETPAKNKYQCHACGFIVTDRNLYRAHILARVEGGSDGVSNLHLLCRRCHLATELLSGQEYSEWIRTMQSIKY